MDLFWTLSIIVVIGLIIWYLMGKKKGPSVPRRPAGPTVPPPPEAPGV